MQFADCADALLFILLCRTDDAEPTKRHQISLYAHITKVSWHFEKQDMVSGTVSYPNTGDIRPFEFDPKNMSQFQVVNTLWDML